MMGCRALAVGLGLAVGATLVAAPSDAAVVICQKGSKLKLRVDACKAKEVAVPAVELGATGPKGDTGDTGPEGPSNLVAAVRVESDGTTGASHAAAGITVTTSNQGLGLSRIALDGTGVFTGLTVGDFIINVSCESGSYAVGNVWISSLTADHADVDAYCFKSDTLAYLGNPVFVTVYKGD
jgi:hypothetical protein